LQVVVIGSGRRRRLIAIGAFVIIVFALVPNILHLDHWSLGAADAHSHTHAAPTLPADEHELHCHTSPAKCSDQPAFAGVWWLDYSGPLIVFGGLMLIAFVAALTRGPQPYGPRVTPPPRYA
jgi:hypothetical protein